jgi:hypothetical protein
MKGKGSHSVEMVRDQREMYISKVGCHMMLFGHFKVRVLVQFKYPLPSFSLDEATQTKAAIAQTILTVTEHGCLLVLVLLS